MKADQKITLTVATDRPSSEKINFIVPSGLDGKDGLTRETTLLKWNLNYPDEAGLFACGRLPPGGVVSGMYCRMRDYLDGMTRTNIIVTYAMLDIPIWSGHSSCAQIDYSEPRIESGTGRIYCDVQMSSYLIWTQYVTIGKTAINTTYRPAGETGASSAGIPVSSDPAKLDCLRFYRSILY